MPMPRVGHGDKAEPAVIDFDHVDPVAQPAAERSLGDRVAAGRAAHLVRPEGKLLLVNVRIDVGENPGFFGHGDWPPGSWETGGSIHDPLLPAAAASEIIR